MTNFSIDAKERALILVEQIQVLSTVTTFEMGSKHIDVILGLITDISDNLQQLITVSLTKVE